MSNNIYLLNVNWVVNKLKIILVVYNLTIVSFSEKQKIVLENSGTKRTKTSIYQEDVYMLNFTDVLSHILLL